MKLTSSSSVSAGAGICSEKAPSMPVLVPSVVPRTTTEAPTTGSPRASITFPLIRTGLEASRLTTER